MALEIYPSLMSADQLNLQKVLTTFDQLCPGYHLDIMDGHFVPNLTWGPRLVNAVAAATDRAIWVHLMVDDPLIWIERFELPVDSAVSFHFESPVDHNFVIERIKEKGWRAGLALRPKTHAEKISKLVDSIDHIVVMSVDPGFSGQQFLPDVLTKVDWLRKYREQKGLRYSIDMDGGVDRATISELARRGVDRVAIGSGIFKMHDPVAALHELQRLLTGS